MIITTAIIAVRTTKCHTTIDRGLCATLLPRGFLKWWFGRARRDELYGAQRRPMSKTNCFIVVRCRRLGWLGRGGDKYVPEH